MNPEQWEAINDIFHEAADIDPSRRAAFLDQACNGDATIRREVETLLAANDAAGDFIRNSPSGISLPSPPSPEHLDPGSIIGHYRVEKIIGTGGMGEVYLASDTKLNRPVAIKRLPVHLSSDPAFLKRFRNEAQAAAILNHPNVATIHSIEDFDGEPFITMEYVDGKPLGALTPEGGMDIRTFLNTFVDVADALQQAHEKGITHRDIKPGNIMVSTGGKPKVLDFGLAQFVAESNFLDETGITQPGQVIGTPAYMSPEQAEGLEVDHRSDIFSLGVVMYEAVTGTRPFRGSSHAEVVANVLKLDPPTVGELRDDVPQLLSRLIARCMAKDRRDRFQSMQEVKTILAESKALLDTGISTGSLGRRLYKETVQTKIAWKVAAAALVTVTAAILGWYFFSLGTTRPAITFDKMSMRRLSQSDNVGYSMLAPDGKSIAYATFEENSTTALWMRRVDDRNTLQLVPPQSVSYWGGLAISEDGGQIFYLTAVPLASHGSLYRVSSLGGPPKKIVETANDVGGISRDGKRILFVRYGDPTQILSANAVDGGDEQPIISSQSPLTRTNFRDPQFSADESSIHYIKYERIDGVESWSINTWSFKSGKGIELLRQSERMGEIAVLRDGSGLLVSSTDPGSNLQQLYFVSLPTGTKTRITNDLNFYFGPSVDRDGKLILASQRQDDSLLWVGDASQLAILKPLSTEPSAYKRVDWTPDGRIVYDALENNRPQIWIADADGRNVQQLTTNKSNNSEPRVSNDGRYIAFTSDRSGLNQVWRMKIDGSEQVLLVDVPDATQEPRFAADGQTVVFSWLREPDRVLGEVPITGGTVKELPRSALPLFNTYYWEMSPDGTRVASVVRDERDGGIKVAITKVGGSEPPTLLNIAPSLIFKWMPDSRRIYYRERQFGEQRVSEAFEIDVERPEPRSLVSVAPDTLIDLTFSRDGKRAAIVRAKSAANVVMMSAYNDNEQK